MPRPKISQAKLKKLEKEWHTHNKWLKQRHMKKQPFEEYVDSVYGVKKISRSSSKMNGPVFHNYRNSETKYPSADMAKANPLSTARKESPVYSGTLVTGIATMHKSNAVPIIDQKQAEEIAKMRRN